MKESKMNRAMNHLDDDLVSEAVTYRPRGKKPLWIRMGAIAAAFALVLVGAFALLPPLEAGATVALDVNPSMEMEVNSKGRVTEVRALNADAVTVLGDMELRDVDLEVAVNALIGSMLKNGYLSAEKNSILISVDSKNARKAEALQKQISEEVSQMLGASNIDASVITQSYQKEKAPQSEVQDKKISPAKAAWIEKVLAKGITDANGTSYTYEQLSAMNVHEMKMLLESKSIEVDGVTSVGKANEGKYIGKEKALELAYAHAELPAEDALRPECEMDYDDGRMLYEVEFRHAGMEYEYELDALTGEILDFDMEEDEERTLEQIPEGLLSDAEAIAIALAKAGVAAEDAEALHCELDIDRAGSVYEISFRVHKLEYDVEIDAASGAVLSYESERED